ncbi:MAG TPA: trehalase family glycosidase [Verrucomicrobiae bacterium]|jgi:alpha,alpha-trehalase|nr:trehalase family glycosidase [Verrucomicrobiae bacterium]
MEKNIETDNPAPTLENPYQACLDYIQDYWPRITRLQTADVGTLIGLPFRYICANHDMFKELYYWDSYFIMLGLEETRNDGLVIEITENILFLMSRFGRIPNANRYYHLSRSQPPFLSSMIRKAYDAKARQGLTQTELFGWLKTASRVAEVEYEQVWRGKKFPDDREVYRGLSRYYDLNIWHSAAEAESGWDMTHRFEDRCLDFIPVDLNSLLFQYETDFALFAKLLGDGEAEKKWQAKREERRKNMFEVLWDNDAGYFYDFDYRRGRRSNVRTVAGFFPMWSRLATPEQAARIVATHLPFFEMNHGIVTTEQSRGETKDFSKQWEWPNGWAPLQWIVISALEKYGFHDEALRIARKWVDLVNRIFLENKVNFEKYNVVDGSRATPDRYPDQAGFGWTNSIFARLVNFVLTGRLWPQRESFYATTKNG